MAIDLFCGNFGFSAGWLEIGGYVVGFDLEHLPHHGPVPNGADLVIQDVLTLHGKQFKDAALIVASPPCTEFSWMAMPWSRAKQVARALCGEDEFPANYRGSRTVAQLTALFDACFRIQREAIEAAGHFIPMVVENVRGAQPWVGRSRANYGSFHLWGDVPALMPMTNAVQKFNPDGTEHPPGSWFAIADSKKRGGMKGSVGTINGSGKLREQSSWDRGQKVPGFRFDGSGSKARKAASAAIAKIPFPLARHIAAYWKPVEHRMSA